MGQSKDGARSEPLDLLIVGGGIMGLWTALKAAEAGLSTLLSSVAASVPAPAAACSAR